MDLKTVCESLQHYPLLHCLKLEKLTQFLRYSNIARGLIEAETVNIRQPPDTISLTIQTMLAACIHENPVVIPQLWSAFKGEVWQARGIAATEDEIQTYNRHALHLKSSYRHLFPPTRVCIFPDCENYRDSNNVSTLVEANTYLATLFTLREGSLPIYTTSLYCRGCNRRYHHNFVVHNSSGTQEYYGGVPEVIEVAEHFFFDRPLLELFVICMLCGWLSALALANIFNHALANLHSDIVNNQHAFPAVMRSLYATELPHGWAPSSMKLQGVHVLNGFFLYSILLDYAEREQVLILEHNINQRDRLKAVLDQRNQRMKGTGQEEYTHACKACFFVKEDENGHRTKIHPAVCDGVTIGHPCCGVHNCQNPLENNRSLYCTFHQSKRYECAVRNCNNPSESNFYTCHIPDHRELENNYYNREKAIFTLRSRLKNAQSTSPVDDAIVMDSSLDLDDPLCEKKPETGNRTLKANFGKRRTHNEQFIIRPCGVILSRTTLFGSEALTAVKDFVKQTFPTPESTPEFFIFDNNCQLHSHLMAQDDGHLKDTAMPVDVFHFKSKHKLTDTHCQKYCNPAAFPEIIEDDEWKINTSICEQTNGWIVKYLAILRDMEATRFCFYLDEMVKRHNRFKVRRLKEDGYCPWNIPVTTLFT